MGRVRNARTRPFSLVAPIGEKETLFFCAERSKQLRK